MGDDDAEVVAVEAALPGVDDEEVPLLPLVVATAAVVAAAAVEPPAVAVAACCATKAEFKRGLRVEVPEGVRGGGERERKDTL